MPKNEDHHTDSSPSSAAATRPPTITLPPRPFNHSLSSSGSGSPSAFDFGFSPGPMTLVSNFFADSDNCNSFSQLLAGVMASPAAVPVTKPLIPAHAIDKGSGGGETSLPANLSIVSSTGLSLLDSPGLALFSPQSPFGMTHQQALAQFTAQAHPNVHFQPDYSSSLSFTSTTTTNQEAVTTIPVSEMTMKGPSFDQKSLSYSIPIDRPADDGYNWRKYGQKQVKGSEFLRSYYKCTYPSCSVKKKVEQSVDGQGTEIIYKGQHNHEPPQPSRRAKESGSLHGNPFQGNEVAAQIQGGNVNKSKENKDQESSQATQEHLSGSSDSEEVGATETAMEGNDEDEPDPKRRHMEMRLAEPTSSHTTVTEPTIIVQTMSEVDLLHDGYRWRKYGQKVVKGNPHPRSYYKCTTPGCNVRKHVERAATDPKAVVTTYEGKHNHDVPAAKSSIHNASSSNGLELRPDNPLSEHRNFDGSDQQPVARF